MDSLSAFSPFDRVRRVIGEVIVRDFAKDPTAIEAVVQVKSPAKSFELTLPMKDLIANNDWDIRRYSPDLTLDVQEKLFLVPKSWELSITFQGGVLAKYRQLDVLVSNEMITDDPFLVTDGVKLPIGNSEVTVKKGVYAEEAFLTTGYRANIESVPPMGTVIARPFYQYVIESVTTEGSVVHMHILGPSNFVYATSLRRKWMPTANLLASGHEKDGVTTSWEPSYIGQLSLDVEVPQVEQELMTAVKPDYSALARHSDNPFYNTIVVKFEYAGVTYSMSTPKQRASINGVPISPATMYNVLCLVALGEQQLCNDGYEPVSLSKFDVTQYFRPAGSGKVLHVPLFLNGDELVAALPNFSQMINAGTSAALCLSQMKVTNDSIIATQNGAVSTVYSKGRSDSCFLITSAVLGACVTPLDGPAGVVRWRDIFRRMYDNEVNLFVRDSDNSAILAGRGQNFDWLQKQLKAGNNTGTVTADVPLDQVKISRPDYRVFYVASTTNHFFIVERVDAQNCRVVSDSLSSDEDRALLNAASVQYRTLKAVSLVRHDDEPPLFISDGKVLGQVDPLDASRDENEQDDLATDEMSGK